MSSNFSEIVAVDGPIQLIIGKTILPGEDGQLSAMDPNPGRPPSGCHTSASQETWRCRGYGAANCHIYPCIRSYETSVENGAVKEKLIATAGTLQSHEERNYTNHDVFGKDGGPNSFDSGYYATINKTCLNQDERRSLQKAGYPLEDTSSVWMPYRYFPYPPEDASYDFTYSTLTPNASGANQFPSTMIQRGCVYIASTDVTEIPSMFAGTLVRNNLLGSGIVGSWDGPQILQTIYNWGNTSFERVESTFQNISDSLTNYIRLHPNDTSSLDNARLRQAAIGVAMHTRTCLKIEWAWFILPAALACLSTLFLVAILCSTSTVPFRTSDWKSSPLPLIYHGLEVSQEDVGDRGSVKDFERIEGMKEHAKKLHVRLGEDGDNSAHLLVEIGKRSPKLEQRDLLDPDIP